MVDSRFRNKRKPDPIQEIGAIDNVSALACDFLGIRLVVVFNKKKVSCIKFDYHTRIHTIVFLLRCRALFLNSRATKC